MDRERPQESPSEGAAPRTVKSSMRIHAKVFALACPFAGSGRVMAYFIAARRPALIDTGVASSPTTVIGPALRRFGARIEDVRYLINTHGHYDHMGGNAQAKALSGGDVLIHREDEHLLEHREDHLRGFAAARWRMLERPELRAEMERTIFENIGGELRADRVLADGDRIDLGDVRLTAVHTPGHTAGSMSYFWEEEGLLFTGDAVQGYGTERGRFPLLFAPGRYRDGLRKVRSLGAEAMAMGHRFRLASTAVGPIVRGEDVASMLAASIEAIELLRTALAGVRQGQAAADGPTVARLATQRLVEHFGFEIDERSGIAPTLTVSLAASLDALAEEA